MSVSTLQSIYSMLSAALGKINSDRAKDNKAKSALKTFLSAYLKTQTDSSFVGIDLLKFQIVSYSNLNTIDI